MASTQSIEAEADSLSEARKEIKSKIPEGFEILSEFVLSGGKIQSIVNKADTIELAYKEALSKISSDMEIVEKKELIAPYRKNIVIEGFDEESAWAQFREKISKTALVNDVVLVEKGSKGLFGKGKKPNRYEFQFYERAVVEIKYKKKARIRVTIHESPKIWIQRLDKKDYGTLTGLAIIKGNDPRFSRKQYDKKHDLYLTPSETENPYGGAKTDAGYPSDLESTVQDILEFWNMEKISYSLLVMKNYELYPDELRIIRTEIFTVGSTEDIMYVVRLGENDFWSWTYRTK